MAAGYVPSGHTPVLRNGGLRDEVERASLRAKRKIARATRAAR
jgi:hypothetical protein